MKAWITWASYALQLRDYCFQCDRIYWRWRYWPHRHGRRCLVVDVPSIPDGIDQVDD